MLKRLSLALASTALIVGASVPSLAAPCRDAKGKFTKCPPKAAAKPQHCRNAKGRFAKCGTPGAMPS